MGSPAARLALSLALRTLSRSALCSAVSETRRALSLALLYPAVYLLYSLMTRGYLLKKTPLHFIDVTCVKLDKFRIRGTTYDTYIWGEPERAPH